MPKGKTSARSLQSARATPTVRSTSPLRSIKSEAPSTPPPNASSSTNPLDIDYRAHPHLYRILRGEMSVFKTNPYSAELKVLWRFRDEAVARESAESLWKRFEVFRDSADFVGMDVTRKFIQMGRTRSLRYALRPGGRKYDKETGQEMTRTGEVHDEEKMRGARVFEGWLRRVEEDEVYVREKARWKEEVEGKGGKGKRAAPNDVVKKEDDCLEEQRVVKME